jgi:hypothetical protein
MPITAIGRQRAARRRSLAGTGLRAGDALGIENATLTQKLIGEGRSQTHIKIVPVQPLGTTPRRPQLPQAEAVNERS